MQSLVQSVDEFLRDRDRGIELVQRLGTPADTVGLAYDLTRNYLSRVGDIPEVVQREWIENAKRLVNMTEFVPLSRVFDFSLVQALGSGNVTGSAMS